MKPTQRVHNRSELKELRRSLRAALTPAEARLWAQLQHRRLGARKFRRQHSVGPYVLDFYCPAARLAVELDGAAHDHEAAEARDVQRSAYLARLDIRVVRFENRHVLTNLEGVLAEINRWLATPSPPGQEGCRAERDGVVD